MQGVTQVPLIPHNIEIKSKNACILRIYSDSIIADGTIVSLTFCVLGLLSSEAVFLQS